MADPPEEPIAGRTAQKRRAILAAATALFLRNGFRGTSMDEVAAEARVSKQTVYKQFADKEGLFRSIIAEIAGKADAIAAVISGAFGPEPATTRDGLEQRLRSVARAYLDGVLQPRVLALRRLIMAEAEQFPDLAASYYEQGPVRGIEVVARGLGPYADRGMIATEDLRLAAAHFAYLTLAVAQDRALFIPSQLPGPAERDRLAAAAARVFVAAHTPVESD